MTDIFTNHTQEEHRQCLADFLPQGAAFGTKNIPGKNLFQLLFGLAAEPQRAEELLNLIYSEYDIRTTELLLENWESALGIPDHCFSTDSSVTRDQRRLHAYIKLTLQGDTRQHFIDLAHALGFQHCEISNGGDIGLYPLPYPWMYFGSVKEAKFTMIVHLSAPPNNVVYPFSQNHYPWTYWSSASSIVECLFEDIAMASVKIIFIYDL